MEIPTATAEKIRRVLAALQDEVLAGIVRARRSGRRDFARVAAVTESDRIYRIDRLSEAALESWLQRSWPKEWPVEIVMEGRAPGSTFPRGLPRRQTRFVLVLDPIDGTRNLMYDKRSAWTLAGLAPQKESGATVADIAVSVMTELPVADQARSERLSAIRGRGARAEVIDLATGRRTRRALRPSSAADCRGGFASVVRFFPEASARLGAFQEALWRRLYRRSGGAASNIFEDQYLTTGGQIRELAVGHDRFVADLRPLAYASLNLKDGLCCHPYDIATALILQEAGGVVERPEGGPLQAPLDAVSPVAWVGYANARLARRMRPAVRRLVREFF